MKPLQGRVDTTTLVAVSCGDLIRSVEQTAGCISLGRHYWCHSDCWKASLQECGPMHKADIGSFAVSILMFYYVVVKIFLKTFVQFPLCWWDSSRELLQSDKEVFQEALCPCCFLPSLYLRSCMLVPARDFWR